MPSDRAAKELDTGRLWEFMRSVLSQGAAIQQDYATGRHNGYEAYSARLDAAARERGDELGLLIDAARDEGRREALKWAAEQVRRLPDPDIDDELGRIFRSLADRILAAPAPVGESA